MNVPYPGLAVRLRCTRAAPCKAARSAPSSVDPVSVLLIGATGATGMTALDGMASSVGSRLKGYVLVRNPSSPAALALKRQGFVLLPGDLDDKASLENVIFNGDWGLV